jgi:hypothetical protein
MAVKNGVVNSIIALIMEIEIPLSLFASGQGV